VLPSRGGWRPGEFCPARLGPKTRGARSNVVDSGAAVGGAAGRRRWQASDNATLHMAEPRCFLIVNCGECETRYSGRPWKPAPQTRCGWQMPYGTFARPTVNNAHDRRATEARKHGGGQGPSAGRVGSGLAATPGHGLRALHRCWGPARLAGSKVLLRLVGRGPCSRPQVAPRGLGCFVRGMTRGPARSVPELRALVHTRVRSPGPQQKRSPARLALGGPGRGRG